MAGRFKATTPAPIWKVPVTIAITHCTCARVTRSGQVINSCQVELNTNTMAAGQTATLSFEARWMHGWPEPLMRLNGNWLEATATLPIPNNLGSPGQPNSTYITNAGPAIYNVTHNPPMPAANQPVVVTANVNDPDGVQESHTVLPAGPGDDLYGSADAR